METNNRFFLLDLSRAMAAICVVLQHYQHFYFVAPHTYVENFTRSQQPFYNLIEPAYKFGSVAVQFFFILSGFIFFMFYKKKIENKKINFNTFLSLRLSRLYPLHLLTLLAMLVFQKLYFFLNSEYFVYPGNDLKNFILHFFLIQEWGFKSSWAYNAPAWSISVELFLYISFFLISLFYIKNLFQSFISIIVVFFLYCIIQPEIAHLIIGIILFYYGGFTFYLYLKIRDLLMSKFKNFFLIFLIFLNIIIFGRFLNSLFLEMQLSIIDLTGDRLMILLYFVKFPLIIINLSILQFYFKNLGKSFQIFGDISYTIYLVHLPIQLLFSMIDKNLIKINFDNNFIFILFFLTIFIISIIVYKFFELPLKNLLRNKLIKIKT